MKKHTMFLERKTILQRYHFQGVLVPWSCSNKLPQTGWHKTMKNYSVTVVEARSLKPMGWLGTNGFFWRLWRRTCLFPAFGVASSQSLEALGFRLYHPNFCRSLHMSFSLCLLFLGLVTGFSAPNLRPSPLEILSLPISAKTPFLMKVISAGTG